tara:strand:+ start:4467 stop:4805 length:339 start_codon:yes stop_codon:yes gene_type:complete
MAKKAKSKAMVGHWAFLIGVLLAVVFMFVPAMTWVSWLLVVLGLIIGLLNIADKEVQSFLLAGLTLVLVSYFGGEVLGTIAYLGTLMNNLLMLFVPATIVVALKSVFVLARN